MTTMLSPRAAAAISPTVQTSNRVIDAPVCERTEHPHEPGRNGDDGGDQEEQELATMPCLICSHPTPFARLAPPLWC
jgi:hypothetical protein